MTSDRCESADHDNPSPPPGVDTGQPAPSNPAFERLARLAARCLAADAAFIYQVDDAGRPSSRAVGRWPAGFEERDPALWQAIAQQIVTQNAPLVIPDVHAHPVPPAHRPDPDGGTRALLGIPLANAGNRPIGAFYVVDDALRDWTPDDVEALRDLAWSALAEIELRAVADEARRSAREAERQRWEHAVLLELTDGIYRVDRDGRCTFVNRAGAEMLGYAPDELIGKRMHGLIHNRRADGSPYPEEECPILQATRRGESVRLDRETLWRRDGTRLLVDCWVIPISEAGEFTGAAVICTDVGEQRVLDRKIRLQERLLDAVGQAVIATDVSGTITYWNRQAEVLYGWAADEVLGRNILDVTPSHVSREQAAEIMERLTRGESWSGVFPVKRRDGTTFPALVTDAPVYDDAGNLTAVIGISTDMTDRLRVEAALEQATRQVESVLERITDAFLALDRDWRFTYVNAEAERLLRRSRDELIGRNVWEEFPEAVGSTFYHQYHQAVASQLAAHFGTYYVPLQLWLEVHAYPGPDGLSVHFRDISGQRRSEQTQRFLGEVGVVLSTSLDYETTLESVARLSVPVFADLCVIDVLDDSGSIRRVAMAHADPEKERLAEDLRRFPPDPDGVHPVARVLRTGQPEMVVDVEMDYLTSITRSGEHARLMARLAYRSFIVVPLMARGRTLGTISFVYTDSGRRYGPDDLTLVQDLARRAGLAVDNARLYREAQDAIRVREEFLSIASHELKTPMTTIKGYVQLAARQLAQPDVSWERVTALHDQLQQQVARLEGLVDDLLDATRLQRGRLDLRRESLDLAALAGQVLERFEQSPDLDPRHRLSLVAPEPLVGEWDAGRLDQVLTNLISNALKYSPDGGEVRVTVTRSGDHAVVSVRDEGIGIVAVEREHLFRPFTRGSVARQGAGGEGLGLYIVSQIVERHGGTITVASEPGEGTTFTVRLPLAPPAEAGLG